MHTEVILLQNLINKGKKGDIVKLKLGYAKYLITKKLATKKTKNTENLISELKRLAVKQFAKEQAEAKALIEQLDNKTITFKMKSHEGKLYGSITPHEVSQQIEKLFSLKIDKKKLEMLEHIKDLGEHEIKVNLHPESECKIKLVIEAE
ncbi:MAG: 50S ribosomal protein L9 [Candidatus Margulisiibacteriota bacterium]|jgi:large subunit ribosomal protein L9